MNDQYTRDFINGLECMPALLKMLTKQAEEVARKAMIEKEDEFECRRIADLPLAEFEKFLAEM